MAKRKIIRIDEDKCNGCGECVPSCAEGAIQVIDGKARLVSEVYCDGLGACLGHCPMDAITIEEREAAAFDEMKTAEHLSRMGRAAAAPQWAKGGSAHPTATACPSLAAFAAPKPAPQPAEPGSRPAFACPGAMARTLSPAGPPAAAAAGPGSQTPSQLRNWPVQLTLVPPIAPWLQDADVLLVADCVPFALPDFHTRFLSGHPVIIACPKLDDARAHVDKLQRILEASSIRSLTVIHMEVPCCTGLLRIAEAALERSGKDMPFRDVTIGIGGDVLKQEWLRAAAPAA